MSSKKVNSVAKSATDLNMWHSKGHKTDKTVLLKHRAHIKHVPLTKHAPLTKHVVLLSARLNNRYIAMVFN